MSATTLIGSETDAFAIDATTSGGTVAIVSGGSTVVNNVAITSFLTNTGTSEKLVQNGTGLTTVAALTVAQEYDPYTSQWGILIEPEATNLCLRSAEFDNASWTPSNATVSADATTSPLGTATADKLVEDSDSGQVHSIVQSINVTDNSTYAFSCFAKAAERSWVRLDMGTAGFASNAWCDFDLSNGLVGTRGAGVISGIEARIVPIGSGWYRCQIVAQADATAATDFSIIIGEGTVADVAGTGTADVTYDGDGLSGIYIWGAQVEVGDFATSHIPTAGATVTRASDFVQVTTADMQVFSATAGSVYSVNSRRYERAAPNLAPKYWTFDDGGTTNAVLAQFTESGNDEVFNAFGNNITIHADSPVAPFVEVAYSVAWQSNNYAGSIDGMPVVTDSQGNVATVDRLTLCDRDDNDRTLSGYLFKFLYVPRRVTDADLPLWRYSDPHEEISLTNKQVITTTPDGLPAFRFAASRLPGHKTTFYANGRYWLFYAAYDEYDSVANTSPLYYISSTNNVNWTAPTQIGTTPTCGVDAAWSIAYERSANRIHYFVVLASAANPAVYGPNGMGYRAGIPQSNGVISWFNPLSTVNAIGNNNTDPQLAIATDGRAWIFNHSVTLRRNNNTDGTWTNATGFPKTSFAGPGGSVYGRLAALAGGRMWVGRYVFDLDGPVLGFVVDTDGTTLTSEGPITQHPVVSKPQGGGNSGASVNRFCVTPRAGKVHLAYLSRLTGELRYRQRSTSGTWGSEIVLATGKYTDPIVSSPAVSVDGDNNLLVAWTRSTGRFYFARSTDDGASFSAPQVYVDHDINIIYEHMLVSEHSNGSGGYQLTYLSDDYGLTYATFNVAQGVDDPNFGQAPIPEGGARFIPYMDWLEQEWQRRRRRKKREEEDDIPDSMLFPDDFSYRDGPWGKWFKEERSAQIERLEREMEIRGSRDYARLAKKIGMAEAALSDAVLEGDRPRIAKIRAKIAEYEAAIKAMFN